MLPTITVDVGTTSVKTSVFDEVGTPLASARAATPVVSDGVGEVYDVPALLGLVRDFVSSLEAGVRAGVRRVAITGVGESGGLVRADGTLASPMVLWHDQRGAEQVASLTDAQRSRVYRLTGLPANPNYGLSKVAWACRAAGPDGVGDAVWLNVAEFLAAWLTGERSSEWSLASRTMALDLRTRAWSPELCELFGVDPGVFPALRPARDGAPLLPTVADELGLDRSVAVHVAGHDHMVGGVAAGLRPGELLTSTGTTEGLLVLRDDPALDAATERSKLANGIACSGEDFTLFASIPTGGSAFATLQGMLGLDAEALAVRTAALHDRWLAGDVDLDRVPIVLPRFRGSPPPTKRASARGAIAGLGTDTTLDDIVLGTFVGLALQFHDVLALFPTRPETIKVIGPAARNPLWLQLKADLVGIPHEVAGTDEVVSVGAQALASGEAGDWAACAPRDVLPDPARHDRLLTWAAGTADVWERLGELS